jgi:hypothetical protein
MVDYSDGDPSRVRNMSAGLRAVNPAIVHTVISGFGFSGPYRDFRSNDFLDLASGGQMYLTGYPDRHPVQAGGPWAGNATGTRRPAPVWWRLARPDRWAWSAARIRMEGTAPCRADNESVRRDILGSPPERIQTLIDAGILATRPPDLL